MFNLLMKKLFKLFPAFLAFIIIIACTDDRDCSEAPSIGGIDEQQLTQDIQEIEEYLEENNIEYDTDPSGVRYSVVESGTGSTPTFCSNINISYESRVLGEDTTFNFDSDADASMSGSIFLGWKFGIVNMNQGADYRFYVPSGLAYGEAGLMRQDSSFVIPPNTNIEFRIRLNRFQ